MVVFDPTLMELAAFNLEKQPLSIVNPNLEVCFELKSRLIHLLYIFRGFEGEDTNKHLKELNVVCSNLKLVGIIEEQVKLMDFPSF